ncbi:hypothetical protein C439_18623 [Haloferax mediterranei ATCC 33500]|nr:hypothetical protein C439_18623 [Haloferax mediterranei ATCC 33500]
MRKRNPETEHKVLTVLVEESPLHVMDIAKTTDCHPITVDHTCAYLYKQGHIHPRGRGRYEVTESGKQQITGGCDS